MSKFLTIVLIFMLLLLSVVYYKKKKSIPHILPTKEEVPITGSTPFEYKEIFPWIKYPPLRNKLSDNSFYADIINHTQNNHVWKDKSTTAHELTHDINSELRDDKSNGFYIGENKAIKFPEPKTTLSRVTTFIPRSLQGSRFNTYLISQRKYWENRPLYLFDEWVAYRNGALVAIEEAEAGNLKEHTDEAFSCLEFCVYTLAVYRAAEADDPDWIQKNPVFVKFMGIYLKKSMETYKIGQRYDNLNWGSEYLRNLQSSEAKPFRDLAKKLTSEDLFSINVDRSSSTLRDGKMLYKKVLERYKHVYLVFFHKD